MAVVCAWVPAAGQNSPTGQEGQTRSANTTPIGRVQVPLVSVVVSVLDKHGDPVEGLRLEAFHVSEDGREQKVAMMNHEDSPVSIGLVIDRSGSMTNKARAANEAVLQFIKTTNVKDEFLLIDFNKYFELVSDADTLRARLNDPTSQGATALLDAIYFGISQMRNAHNARKVLLVVTDGMDNESRYTASDLRSILKETDVQVYFAIIADSMGFARTEEYQNGFFVDLKGLCSLSGGEAFQVRDLKDLSSVLTTISADLRKQYVIGYYSTNGARNGKWRSLKIKVDVPRDLRPAQVFTRSGYYSPVPIGR